MPILLRRSSHAGGIFGCQHHWPPKDNIPNWRVLKLWYCELD